LGDDAANGDIVRVFSKVDIIGSSRRVTIKKSVFISSILSCASRRVITLLFGAEKEGGGESLSF